MKYLPFFLICLLTLPAFAEGSAHSHDDGDLMPAKKMETSVNEKAPAIYLSMDKSELVRLDENAASVIVGNPVHANVLMDSPNMLVVVPRAPGATHFTVLNQSGQVILQRHVIVAAPKENYIRVKTATCGDNADCTKTANYYCETDGMCHEIISEEQKAASAAATGDDNAGGQGGAQQGNGQPPADGEEPQ